MTDNDTPDTPEQEPEQPRKKGGRPKGSKSKHKQHFSRLASTKGVPSDVMAEIAELRKELEIERGKRTEAEKKALAAAETQGMLMQRSIQEIPTGKTVRLQRLKEYKVVGYRDDANARPILKPVFEPYMAPTFFYKIDLPPCGGSDIKINGQSFYHGGTYEFDEGLLRSIKEIVYRTWKHDADIHGSDENAYRKPQKPVISMRRAAA